MQTAKEEVKSFLLAGDMTLYLKILKTSQENLYMINTFSILSGYKKIH